MKTKFSFLALFLFLIVFKPFPSFGLSATPPKDVTLLIYYSGDNRLSDFMHSSYLRVLREGAGPSVNVVVQYDGEKDRDSFRVAIGHQKIGSTYQQTFFEKNIEYDMGKPETLADFVKWGKAQFPAKRTMLVISSHGFGILNSPFESTEQEGGSPVAKLASSIDESSRSFMAEEDLKKQLAQALRGEKLDLLVHNSCLMGSLESLSILASVAKYAVASEYSIYMNKADDLVNNEARTILIENILAQIKANPSVSEQDIGKKIVQDFEANYRNFQFPSVSDEVVRLPSTMAFYDLSRIGQLGQKYSDLSLELRRKAATDPQVLTRLFDENLKARYVDNFGYLDFRVLYKAMTIALDPSLSSVKMAEMDRLLSQVVPHRVALFTQQTEPIAHLHVFFPSILTQGDLSSSRKDYSQIQWVQQHGLSQWVDYVWKSLEQNQDIYWRSKLKLWDQGKTIVVKPGSQDPEYDFFLQLDMMAIRLANLADKTKLKQYQQTLQSIHRSSPEMKKHKDYVATLLQ